MSYKIDEKLEKGMSLLAEGKKIDEALSLINYSARKGSTKGKSYFEIGRVLREGVPGLEPNIEESRRYYDYAMNRFYHSNKDSMDYREMGDYYYFGLGTEPADKNKALEAYDKAAADGDTLAKERADEIRGLLVRGSSENAPTLTPDTEARIQQPMEEIKGVANIVPGSASDAIEAADAVAPAPAIENENGLVEAEENSYTDKVINDEIDGDQLLIKALKVLDSASATMEEKKDAFGLVRIASDSDSLRADVLLGYFYEGDTPLCEMDLEKSKGYYEKAIALGSSAAKYRLGILFLDDEASYYDVEKGHNLIIESAHDGYPFALAYLGDLFRAKVEDTRNLAAAYRYYSLAGERGLGYAFHCLAEIDASRQQLDLAARHEKLAFDNGYDKEKGYQDPAFYDLHF